MKYTFILILLICFTASTLAEDNKDRGFSTTNAGSSFFIGKIGFVHSTLEIYDGNKYKNDDCYIQYQSFEIDNWHVEFGMPCNSSNSIKKWFSKNNHENFKKYKILIQNIKSFTSYLYENPIKIHLTVVFIDRSSIFKKSYRQLVVNKLPIHIMQYIDPQMVAPEESVKFYGYLAEVFSHELFHLYSRKIIRKKNREHNNILKLGINDEALATIIGKCSEFSVGAPAFDNTTYKDLKKFYLNGENVSEAYPKTKLAQSTKRVESNKFYENSFGYAHARYAMWNQFGTDVQPTEYEKINNIMKYCRFIVDSIPSIQKLQNIQPSDYQNMPDYVSWANRQNINIH